MADTGSTSSPKKQTTDSPTSPKKHTNFRPCTNSSMSRDSSYSYIHFTAARHADLFEDFCKDKLPDDEIYVPPQNQPLNPEDEDDVVPDQHAAFGIQRATQKTKESAWKDLGLKELMTRGPDNNGTGVKGVRGGGSRMPR